MFIRKLIKDDLENCIQLFMEVFNQPPWNNNWTYEIAHQFFVDLWNTPGFRGYVAISESKEDSIWSQSKAYSFLNSCRIFSGSNRCIKSGFT